MVLASCVKLCLADVQSPLMPPCLILQRCLAILLPGMPVTAMVWCKHLMIQRQQGGCGLLAIEVEVGRSSLVIGRVKRQQLDDQACATT